MFFFEENWVQRAVHLAGGPTRTSNRLGVSNAAVHKWIAGRRVPNLEKAKHLAKLSKVAVGKLRPV